MAIQHIRPSASLEPLLPWLLSWCVLCATKAVLNIKGQGGRTLLYHIM